MKTFGSPLLVLCLLCGCWGKADLGGGAAGAPGAFAGSPGAGGGGAAIGEPGGTNSGEAGGQAQGGTGDPGGAGGTPSLHPVGCQPGGAQTIAQLAGTTFTRIVVDADSVYVASDGEVGRVVKGGQHDTLMKTSGATSPPYGLAVDGDDVYIASYEGGLVRVPKNGGAATSLVNQHLAGVSVNKKSILFSVTGGGALHYLDKATNMSGETQVVMVPSEASDPLFGIASLVADDARAYSRNSNHVFATDVATATSEALVSMGFLFSSELVQDSAHLYWGAVLGCPFSGPSSCVYRVHKPDDETTPAQFDTVIAANDVSYGPLAADDAGLFVVERGEMTSDGSLAPTGPAKLTRVDETTGAQTDVITEPSMQLLAVDDACLYWVTDAGELRSMRR